VFEKRLTSMFQDVPIFIDWQRGWEKNLDLNRFSHNCPLGGSCTLPCSSCQAGCWSRALLCWGSMAIPVFPKLHSLSKMWFESKGAQSSHYSSTILPKEGRERKGKGREREEKKIWIHLHLIKVGWSFKPKIPLACATLPCPSERLPWCY